jgi:hypothetical protein
MFARTVPDPRDGEKISTGGSLGNTLKKLNGLKLINPSRLMVEASAIGLGVTADSSQPCFSPGWQFGHSESYNRSFFLLFENRKIGGFFDYGIG